MLGLFNEIRRVLRRLGYAKMIAGAIILLIVGYFIVQNQKFIDSVSLNVNLRQDESSGKASTQQVSKGDSRNETKSRPVLRIEDVRLTPSRFEKLNFLYARIVNTGSIEATNVVITIDLGFARANEVEIRQTELCELSQRQSALVIGIQCGRIPAKREVEVSVLLSEPSYRSITASAANGSLPTSRAFLESDRSGEEAGFGSFLIGLLKALLIILVVFFVLLLLKRFFGDSL
jgi:hypothetical protein